MRDRDEVIRQGIQQIGLDSFPEDTEVAWRVWAIRHEGSYSAVDADASPATVGYDKFRFVLRFQDEDRFTVVGRYCYEGGRWRPLFSDPAASDEWRALFDARMSGTAPGFRMI